jgi:hypothetical protein
MANERLPDSIKNAEERSAAIRAESERIEREQAVQEAERKLAMAQREEEIRQVEDIDIAQTNLLAGTETREYLLERIREMRNATPIEVVPVPHLTESMQAALDAEQDLGRRMVAKAEAEQAKVREMRARMEADERKLFGHMAPVHQANPAQTEAFPVVKATFGKPK